MCFEVYFLHIFPGSAKGKFQNIKRQQQKLINNSNIIFMFSNKMFQKYCVCWDFKLILDRRWEHGKNYENGTLERHLDGRMDEIIVFDDILTTDEIDAIRDGTYL